MDKSQLLLAASRRRRRARGVAMVEGAVIFPIMSFFLVYLELAHHSFDAYLSAEHVAEQRTWSSVTAGSFTLSCPKGRDDTSYAPSYFKMDAIGGGGDDSAGGNPDTSGGGGGGRINSGAVAGQGPGGWAMHHDTAAAQVTVSRGGVVYDGAAHKPTARSKVFCNQPWVGSLWDIISSAL